MRLSTGDNLLLKREHLVILLRFKETITKRHSIFFSIIFFLTASTKTKVVIFFPKIKVRAVVISNVTLFTQVSEVKCFLFSLSSKQETLLEQRQLLSRFCCVM